MSIPEDTLKKVNSTVDLENNRCGKLTIDPVADPSPSSDFSTFVASRQSPDPREREGKEDTSIDNERVVDCSGGRKDV